MSFPSDIISKLQLTIARSEAVSLYKLLQRGKAEAKRQFKNLPRIDDRRKDCNGHLYNAADKLRDRILEILSARLPRPSARAPGNASSKEIEVLRSLNREMHSRPATSSFKYRYLGPGKRMIRTFRPAALKEEHLFFHHNIKAFDMAGEVGKALLVHEESFDVLAEASIAVEEEVLGERFRLQHRFAATIQPLLEKLRLELSSDIFAVDWHCRPLAFDLHYCIRFLESPGYWNHQDCLGTPVLHFLIENIEMLSDADRGRFLAKLATHDFSGNEPVDKYHRTPLHIAAQRNMFDVAVALLKSGMRPDMVTKGSKHTPLHYAASLGSVIMCDLLLEHGADINARTRAGNTPLMVTLAEECLHEHEKAYQVFLYHPSVDVNNRNLYGETAMHMAVHRKNMGAIHDLVPRFDESINSRNLKGETALGLAAEIYEESDALELAKHLFQSIFIKPDVWDGRGLTPLHRGVLRGHLQLCHLLATRRDGGLFGTGGGRYTPSELAYRKNKGAIWAMLKEVECQSLEEAENQSSEEAEHRPLANEASNVGISMTLAIRTRG